MPSVPPALNLVEASQENASLYTLATIPQHTPPSSSSLEANPPPSAISPLFSPDARAYGSIRSNRSRSSRKALFTAALKMAAIFLISTLLLGGTLWLALPTIDEDDRPLLHVPKSFAQLKELNSLLKKYRDIYPYRIVVCFVSTYLFLQAFSLPGSMYLSILGGAVWGVPRALLLVCTCIATGASLCYAISAAFGPALLTLPKWKARLQKWSETAQSHKDNIISFLIVLRIAPLPPHWVVNVICPHVGIGLVPFWVSTWLGVLGVSVIHTTIGRGLDEMTSADDFHLISWRNFFGLAAVVVAALIPVGLRYYFKRDVATVADMENMEEGLSQEHLDDEEDQILQVGPRVAANKAKKSHLNTPSTLSDDESEDFFDDDSGDSDVILEAGPALVAKSTYDDGPHQARDLESEINS